jgi:hypothetical protein
MRPIEQDDGITGGEYSLSQNAQIPTTSTVPLHQLDHVGHLMPAGECGTGLPRLRHLNPRATDLQDVTDTYDRFSQSADRQIFAKCSKVEAISSPLCPPAWIVRSGIHQECLIRTAMHSGVSDSITLEAQSAELDRPSDRFFPDCAGKGPRHGIRRKRISGGPWCANLNGENLHSSPGGLGCGNGNKTT